MSRLVHYAFDIADRETWAVVADGQVSHRILTSQLLTRQAAACGYEPRNEAWKGTTGRHARATSARCARCAKKGSAQ